MDWILIRDRIIAPRCFECHKGVFSEGGYDLSIYENLFADGLVKPGDAANSYLFKIMDSGDMPDDVGRVSQKEIDFVKLWIDEGAIEVVGN